MVNIVSMVIKYNTVYMMNNANVVKPVNCINKVNIFSNVYMSYRLVTVEIMQLTNNDFAIH